MLSILIRLIIIIVVFDCILSYKDEVTEKIRVGCRERNRLLGSNKTDHFEMIEVFLNATLELKCHYCNENDENEPRIWYKIDYFHNITPHELEIDMNKNETLNKNSVTPDYQLTINRIDIKDGGIYYCQGIQGQKSENMFNYVVDVVFENSSAPEKGNLTLWKSYDMDYLIPVNKQFETSNGSDLVFIREKLEAKIEVITDWELNWRPCQVCGRPQGDGRQEKYGYCRIKIENDDNLVLNLSTYSNSETYKYFLMTPKITCNSLLLNSLFPQVYNRTKWLPDFILARKCSGLCNPNPEGINNGWKFGKSKKYKYRKSMVLQVGVHLAVICPESTLDNTVIWRRDGKVLTKGQIYSDTKDGTDPHIVVDSFNSLYLFHITKNLQGNYSCQVDDIRMQLLRVYVIGSSRLLSKKLLRHMLYLSIVLLLTCSCYCAGLVVTCRNKHKFKQYEEIPTEEV